MIGPEDEHTCLGCSHKIGLGEAETAVRAARGPVVRYMHTSWQDCQRALRAAESVRHPRHLSTTGRAASAGMML
jgi:hypothetical protein